MNQLASSGQLRASFLRWALVLVPLVMLLGFVSAQISGSGPDNPWFASLEKPSLYPPAIVFPVVWTLLYIMMGLAAATICAARGASGRAVALLLFAGQLVLNLVWSPLFFGMHQMTMALWLLVALDLIVLVTVILFWRVRPLAGMLLLPYLAWILFATVLNWQFLVANPGADGDASSNAVERVEF